MGASLSASRHSSVGGRWEGCSGHPRLAALAVGNALIDEGHPRQNTLTVADARLVKGSFQVRP